jgi:hypothetical protein
MAYVTPDEVIGVMEECSLTSEQVDPYILSAHLFVTDILKNSGLSASRLKDIEKYLAAHFIASIHSRPSSREKVGEVEVEYSNTKFGEGLKSTPYGQMVSMLDTTGLIAASGKRAATFFVPKSFDE